jgi:hypothetical protein
MSVKSSLVGDVEVANSVVCSECDLGVKLFQIEILWVDVSNQSLHYAKTRKEGRPPYTSRASNAVGRNGTILRSAKKTLFNNPLFVLND